MTAVRNWAIGNYYPVVYWPVVADCWAVVADYSAAKVVRVVRPLADNTACWDGNAAEKQAFRKADDCKTDTSDTIHRRKHNWPLPGNRLQIPRQNIRCSDSGTIQFPRNRKAIFLHPSNGWAVRSNFLLPISTSRYSTGRNCPFGKRIVLWNTLLAGLLNQIK
jgi:hypothetical protein